jgi:hypothetical protein
VRPGLTSDINCVLVAQTPLSDIEEGECWSLELLYFFAIETGNNKRSWNEPSLQLYLEAPPSRRLFLLVYGAPVTLAI